MTGLDLTMSPRGIGLNWLPCFICGHGGRRADQAVAQADMASFVRNKESGEAIVEIFKSVGLRAKLDFRESEPSWVQVKVGACRVHEPNLLLLGRLVSGMPHPTITHNLLEQVIPGSKP